MCESLPFMARKPRAEAWQHIDLLRLQAEDYLQDLKSMLKKKISLNYVSNNNVSQRDNSVASQQCGFPK